MTSTSDNLSRYSILIVDDVPLNCTLVQKMVARFNFDVRTAGNGLECLREVIARKPDLILLDLMMPILLSKLTHSIATQLNIPLDI